MFSKFVPQNVKLKRWWRRLLILMATLCVLLILGHLTIRFWLWPQLETSKPTIERLIGARLGVQVEIDQLAVAWTGIRPSFQIQGLRFVNAPNKKAQLTSPLLEIKRIDGELSWLSLYHLKPYFHRLEFDDAQIQMRRELNGNLTIAGIDLKTSPNDYSGSNWLLEQDQLIVNHVQISWQDLARNSSPIPVQLDHLELTNGSRSHQGQLRIQSP